MAADMLNSPRAVEASVYMVRAFVRMREVLLSSKELASRLDALEKKLSTHDQAITGLIDAIRQLTALPQTKNAASISSSTSNGALQPRRPVEFLSTVHVTTRSVDAGAEPKRPSDSQPILPVAAA